MACPSCGSSLEFLIPPKAQPGAEAAPTGTARCLNGNCGEQYSVSTCPACGKIAAYYGEFDAGSDCCGETISRYGTICLACGDSTEDHDGEE